MYYRIAAAGTIAKKNIFETLISPGFYIAVAIGLLTGFFLVAGFAACVGSSGFKPELHPVYELINKTITGAFGETLATKLFSEGPFLFALFFAFLPVLFYLALGSVFKFGLEKNTGALELIVYGPADGTSCFLGAFVKNVMLTAGFLAVLLVYFSIAALLYNLVLGPIFFYALGLIFFMALAVYAYSILAAVITGNAASGIILFLIIFIIFTLLQIGSFALVSGYMKNLAGIFSWLLQWFSPVYYWNQGLDMVDYGKGSLYALNIGYLVILSCALLILSHLVLRLKGVRE